MCRLWWPYELSMSKFVGSTNEPFKLFSSSHLVRRPLYRCLPCLQEQIHASASSLHLQTLEAPGNGVRLSRWPMLADNPSGKLQALLADECGGRCGTRSIFCMHHSIQMADRPATSSGEIQSICISYGDDHEDFRRLPHQLLE